MTGISGRWFKCHLTSFLFQLHVFKPGVRQQADPVRIVSMCVCMCVRLRGH